MAVSGKRLIKIVIAVLIIFIAAFLIYRSGYRRGVAGIPDPVQTPAEGYEHYHMGGYDMSVDKMYRYEIEALVVHTKDYLSFDLGDQMSRHDFALAWGKIAEYNDRVDFHWSQSGRRVFVDVNDPQANSLVGNGSGSGYQLSNNHLIPANDSARLKLWAVRRGDHIRITGYLVNVDGHSKDGSTFVWHSSTSRNDTGDGACEVIFVEDVSWL